MLPPESDNFYRQLLWKMGPQIYLDAVSYIYQDMIDVIVYLSIRLLLSEFNDVVMWESCTFNNYIF
jgi:hypothetical protein